MRSSIRGSKWVTNPRLLFGMAVIVTFTVAALLAPWLAPTAPDEIDIAMRLMPPGPGGLLGRDLTGGSVLTAMLYGGRTSLYISVLTVALSVSVGTWVGLVAGYKRGWIDTMLMRLVDLLMAFPGILLAMALAAMLGPSRSNVILAISATGWTSAARLMRAQTLSIREREYVTASRALGAKDARLLWRHIFPATLTPLLVHATFSLSGVIVVEASLSFLGLGAQDGAPSWGALLAQGRTVLVEAPYLSIVPGIAIALLVLALNFVGDAMRDLLDPRKQ
ncbi:MAG: ABC transporter permease [Deltaproteobacteria bacterium]|nr:ABC transporter permease [Deltaproteobacteria bacterium]